MTAEVIVPKEAITYTTNTSTGIRTLALREGFRRTSLK